MCRSFLPLSIDVLVCLQRLRVPSTVSPRDNIMFWLEVAHRPFFLHTQSCQSSFFLILSNSIPLYSNTFQVISLRILLVLILPAILLSQLIAASRILLPSSFLRYQHLDPYTSIGVTNALYKFFVLVDMLRVFHILLNLPIYI